MKRKISRDRHSGFPPFRERRVGIPWELLVCEIPGNPTIRRWEHGGKGQKSHGGVKFGMNRIEDESNPAQLELERGILDLA